MQFPFLVSPIHQIIWLHCDISAVTCKISSKSKTVEAVNFCEMKCYTLLEGILRDQLQKPSQRTVLIHSEIAWYTLKAMSSSNDDFTSCSFSALCILEVVNILGYEEFGGSERMHTLFVGSNLLLNYIIPAEFAQNHILDRFNTLTCSLGKIPVVTYFKNCF